MGSALLVGISAWGSSWALVLDMAQAGKVRTSACWSSSSGNRKRGKRRHGLVTMRIFCCMAGLCLGLTGAAHAAVFSFDATDFILAPVFSDVQDFSVSIDFNGPVVAGGSYGNTDIVSVDYEVSGSLAEGTPSGFPAFALTRNGIDATEFDQQGSTFILEVSPTAILSDGLQFNEISRLVLDFMEEETGRYHPPLFQLEPDGTGSIRNSANSGGVNPVTQKVVDVEQGEEYITEFTFDPETLTLSLPSAPLDCYAITGNNDKTIVFCL